MYIYYPKNSVLYMRAWLTLLLMHPARTVCFLLPTDGHMQVLL